MDRVDDVIQKRGEGIHGVEWEGEKIGVDDGETMAGCCGRVDVWAGHLQKEPDRVCGLVNFHALLSLLQLAEISATVASSARTVK